MPLWISAPLVVVGFIVAAYGAMYLWHKIAVKINGWDGWH